MNKSSTRRKNNLVGLRLDDQEDATLDSVSVFFGIGRQETIRMLVKSAADQINATKARGAAR